jgi:hypothetical protein
MHLTEINMEINDLSFQLYPVCKAHSAEGKALKKDEEAILVMLCAMRHALCGVCYRARDECFIPQGHKFRLSLPRQTQLSFIPQGHKFRLSLPRQTQLSFEPVLSQHAAITY